MSHVNRYQLTCSLLRVLRGSESNPPTAAKLSRWTGRASSASTATGSWSVTVPGKLAAKPGECSTLTKEEPSQPWELLLSSMTVTVLVATAAGGWLSSSDDATGRARRLRLRTTTNSSPLSVGCDPDGFTTSALSFNWAASLHDVASLPVATVTVEVFDVYIGAAIFWSEVEPVSRKTCRASNEHRTSPLNSEAKDSRSSKDVRKFSTRHSVCR